MTTESETLTSIEKAVVSALTTITELCAMVADLTDRVAALEEGVAWLEKQQSTAPVPATKAIPMTKVSSSNVGEIGYDADGNMLVRFHSGALYSYQGVPKSLFDDILASESVGSALNSSVKGLFECKRIN